MEWLRLVFCSRVRFYQMHSIAVEANCDSLFFFFVFFQIGVRTGEGLIID